MRKSISILGCVVFLATIFMSAVFAADVKVSGKIYANYIYDLTDLGKGKGFNRVNMDKACFTLKSDIADRAQAVFNADVYQNSRAVSFKAGDGSEVTVPSYYNGWSIRLKKAYVDLKLIPNTIISFGMIETPWISHVEDAWGYDFVRKTLAYTEDLFSSKDLGIGLAVKLPGGYGEGVIQVLNGTGYSKSEDNKYKDIIPRITITPLPSDKILKGLALSGYYYLGKRSEGDRDDLTRNRLGALLSFSYDFLSIGGEFDMSTDQKLKDSNVEDVNGSGFSAFGEVKLNKIAPLKDLAIFGRFDSWDPNTDKENDAHTALIAGLCYTVANNVRAAIDMQQTTYETDLYKMGIVKKETTDKTARQILCQVEVKF